jgi:hypothetical protein
MKLSRLLLALALAAPSSLLRADIVTLKDGKKLEGTILEERPDGVFMKYKVTAKIMDEKFIPKAEIADGGILKEKPEEIEIKELRKLLPTADLLTAEKYEQLIQDRLRPFVNRYPGTKEADEIKKMIDELQAEKEKVVAGGMKMEGRWLSPQDARAEKYNVDAYTLRVAMNEKAAAGDYSAALREFDAMSDKRKFHFTSVHYPKAVEEALAIMMTYDAKLSQMIKDQPVLQKQRDENQKRLIEPDLSRAKAAVDREVQEAAARFDVEKKESKWVTPYKYDLKRLQELQKNVFSEKTKLQKIDVAQITKINDALHQATIHYYNDKIVEGELALAEVMRAAAGNSEYSSIVQTYIGGFRRKRAEYAAKLQAANTNAAIAPGTVPGVVPGAPGADAAVARALAMAGGTTPVQGQPVPAGAVQQPGMMPQGVAPQQPGMTPQGVAPQAPMQPGMAPQGMIQQPGMVQPQPAAPYAQPAPVAPAPPAEEEGSISMETILMVAGGAVVLVLLLVILLNKKKQ